MLEKVQGIVLRTVKVGDTKLIVDIFTLSHGRLSFVTTFSHSKQSRSLLAFWTPLSLLEFQADIRLTSTSLPKPKDVRFYYNYKDSPFNPLKSTILLFLAEFISASLRNESTNVPLYRFLEMSLQYLDGITDSASLANFHLIFLLRLSRFLGILPNIGTPDSSCFNGADGIMTTRNPFGASQPLFDLLSSTYTNLMPPHKYYLMPDEASILPLLFRLNYSTMHLLRLSRAQRARFLEVVITYYRLHIPGFPELKSLPVLHEVFA